MLFGLLILSQLFGTTLAVSCNKCLTCTPTEDAATAVQMAACEAALNQIGQGVNDGMYAMEQQFPSAGSACPTGDDPTYSTDDSEYGYCMSLEFTVVAGSEKCNCVGLDSSDQWFDMVSNSSSEVADLTEDEFETMVKSYTAAKLKTDINAAKDMSASGTTISSVTVQAKQCTTAGCNMPFASDVVKGSTPCGAWAADLADDTTEAYINKKEEMDAIFAIMCEMELPGCKSAMCTGFTEVTSDARAKRQRRSGSTAVAEFEIETSSTADVEIADVVDAYTTSLETYATENPDSDAASYEAMSADDLVLIAAASFSAKLSVPTLGMTVLLAALTAALT